MPTNETGRSSAASGWVAALPLAIGLIAGMGPGTHVPQPTAATAEAAEAVAVTAAAAPRAALNASQNAMVAHFINVGQANATLLEFACGAVLIDAGAQEQAQVNTLLSYLEDFFARRPDLQRTLDSIIITHNHVDHTRALREVVERFRVERFLENGQRGGNPQGDADVDWLEANQSTGGRSITVLDVDDSSITGKEGFTDENVDPVACPGVDPEIRVLSADLVQDPGWGDAEFENKNNHSIVVRVDFGESSFLFTGDLEELAIATMLDFYSGSDTLDADVYEVGHHGSRNGTTEELLNAVTPDIAVISMGPWDDKRQWTAYAYGHPRKQAVDLLAAQITQTRLPRSVHVATAVKKFYSKTMRDAIYGTGWDGNISIQASADGNKRVQTGL